MKRLTGVKENRHKVTRGVGWDSAIADAENRLSIAQERVGTLRQVLADFKEMKRKGERWPGDSATQTQN